MFMYLAFVFVFLSYFAYFVHVDIPPIMLNWGAITGILVYAVIPLLGARMLRDFGNAFKIVFSRRKETNVTKMKRAIDAVELEVRSLLLGTALLVVGILIKLLYDITLPDITQMKCSLGDYLSTVGFFLIYALLIASLLLPLKYRIKGMLADYMNSPEE